MTIAYDFIKGLMGSWSFTRSLPAYGQMTGEAQFTEICDNGPLYKLVYEERGLLATSLNKTHQMFQAYGYCYSPLRDKIAVYFIHDGEWDKLFYELVFQEQKNFWIAYAQHACKEDMYYARYHLMNEDKFSIQYQVVGPTKNYSLSTLFQRKIEETECQPPKNIS